MIRRTPLGRSLLALFAATASFSLVAVPAARAQTPPAPTGAPPAEGKAIVDAPKGPAEPKIEDKVDGTTASVSAGGMQTSGNSRALALSANGTFETRFHDNGIGASVLGNYGQGGPAGQGVQVTTQNLQARLRYDRYIVDRLAAFLIHTGRHDRFQGLDFRYNLDPGVKYLFLREASNTLWAEAGYDLQHDIRRDADRVVLDADKKPVLDPSGAAVLLDRTQTDHSSRLFVGFKRGFSQEVTLATGVEYMQSFVASERARVNFDALVAAKLVGGLALGLGFSARYDNAPLPGKDHLDTSMTGSLIYAFSDAPEPPKPQTCPCPPDVPAAPPAAPPPPPAPAPAPAPEPSTAPTPF